MDDVDFKLVRKNLNILSVLILVLAFTDAKLSSMNILGLSINLNPHKFYVILYIGYIYFLWRFLTKVPIQSGFMQDFNSYYLNGVNGVKSKFNYDTLKTEFIQASREIKDALDMNDPQFGLVQLRVILAGTSISRLRFSGNFRSTTAQDRPGGSFTVDIDKDIPWSFYIRKLFWFSIRHDKFGDYLFRFIPVTVNLVLVVTHSDWQGSIWSITG